LRSDANDTTTGQLTVDNDNGVKVVYGTETTNLFYTGYGMDSQRGTTYIRPLTDNTQTLYIGNSSNTLDWNTIAMKVGNDDNVTINDNKVFHAGNDGSGSGLDADTVDGIQASSFLRSDANDSTSGKITSTTSSGDFLEYNGSATGPYFRFKTSGTNNGYIQFSTTSAYFWNDRQTRGFRIDGTNNPAFYDSTAYRTIWHSGNDGSGSGLDADTLDGQHGSYYHPTNTTILQQGGDITNQNWNNYFDGTEASWNTVINHSGSNRPSSAYTYGTALSFGKASAGRFQLYAPHNGSEGQSLWYRTGWNTDYDAWAKIWDSSNDGSGSGLDADTTDGYQASESSTASTLAARTSSGHLYMNYGISTYLNMSHTAYQRDSDTIFYSSGDSYIRKNNATGFKNSLGLGTGDSPSFNNVAVAASVYHEGDTDTYLSFDTNAAYLATGGTTRLTVNSSGVRLGDTGNGYFQPVSGQYGSIQIDGGAHNFWEGYSIGGRAVFMHDNANAMGLYDDVNNHWAVYHAFNGATSVYYDGVEKFNTTSTGANINGDLNAVDNIYVASNIYHEGDTNTSIGMETDAIRLKTGGADFYFDGQGLFITSGSLAEVYNGLSGTTPTCNVDNAGAFSLTMTGNTTFTFSGPNSGYSQGFVLQLTGNGGTVTWPTSVDWAGGTAPDAPASGETDIYVFWTRDGGTTWYGVLSVDAAA
jgi:hypothetical protein